jgi:hypothetical protein
MFMRFADSMYWTLRSKKYLREIKHDLLAKQYRRAQCDLACLDSDDLVRCIPALGGVK